MACASASTAPTAVPVSWRSSWSSGSWTFARWLSWRQPSPSNVSHRPVSASREPSGLSSSGQGWSRSRLQRGSTDPLRLRTRPRGVLEHAHLLHGDEALAHHLVEDLRQLRHAIFGVDDLDHDRQVLGEAEELRGVEHAVRPEARDAAE